MIITLLRLFFIAVLVSMLGATTWASQRVALWDIMPGIAEQPWFVATLFDAYFGFLTFYAWVLYKETRWGARGLWLLAILLLVDVESFALTPLLVKKKNPVHRRHAPLQWKHGCLFSHLNCVAV